jgi:putative MATE family efflux protein
MASVFDEKDSTPQASDHSESVSPPRKVSDAEILEAPVKDGRHREWSQDNRGTGSDPVVDGGTVQGSPNRLGRDFTKGSVPGNLWVLAWPQMVEGVLNSVDQLADIFWAGRVGGFRAIAGLGVAQAYTRLLQTVRQGLDVGMQAMVSRSVGAQRMDLANHIALQAFSLTAFFSITIAVIGFFLTEPMLRILGVSDSVIAQTELYMQIQFIGAAAMGFRMSSAATLQSAGDAITPMKATVLARIVHLILSPILIFGPWGLPSMGIAGAAVATVIAHSLATAWNFKALFSGTSQLHLTLEGYRPDPVILWRLLRIGVPASITGAERVISELVLVRLVTPFGDAALAAYSLTKRLEFLTGLGSQGLGRASGVIVGHNLGAGQPERAKSTVRWAITFVMSVRGSMGLLLIAFPAMFMSIFDPDPEFLEVGATWLRIQAVGGLVMGAGMVYQMSFNVAGDTMAPMIVTLITMWGIEVPGAFLLSRYTAMGQYGIPVAVSVAMIFRIIIYTGYFVKGRWLRVRVITDS